MNCGAFRVEGLGLIEILGENFLRFRVWGLAGVHGAFRIKGSGLRHSIESGFVGSDC